jgi:hypothetical protein
VDIQKRFQEAVQSYWDARDRQRKKQEEGGALDAGLRGAVTGGTQMGALELLVVDIFKATGLDAMHIRTRTGLELPGYFRPEKEWDLIVVADGKLVCAIEFKSQVGPSFGNNANNRAEEAIGNATDIWTAYREQRLGIGPRPFLGYFFLLEDCSRVHSAVKPKEPCFQVDPIFKNASYTKRYEILCRRLVLERLYDSACLTLATHETPTRISHPAEDLSFNRFVADLRSCAMRFVESST